MPAKSSDLLTEYIKTREAERMARFAEARAARALASRLMRAKTALSRFNRIGSRLIRDPRNSHKGETGISVLDLFQNANALLNKQYDFCCSHPEQLPIFFEMHKEAMNGLAPAMERTECIL